MPNSDAKPMLNRKWLLPALVIPFLGLSSLMIAAGAGQVATPPVNAKLHDVQVMALEMLPGYQQRRLAYGRVEVNQQASVGFELGGTLMAFSVDEGDSFHAGDVLATMDTQRLRARKAELQAALKRSEADARLAQLSEKRVVQLVRDKLESEQRLDEAREATQAAFATVTEMQARVASLDVDLQKSTLIAPFDGAVISRPVDIGTVVAVGQAVLVIQQTAQLEARIALAANDAMALTLGDRYTLLTDSGQVQARLKSVAPQRRLDTRTVDALFALDPNAQHVLPGDLLAVEYYSEIGEPGSWVPRQALNSGVRGLWNLYTVSGQGEQKIAAKAVEVLYTEDDRVFVRGALKKGELLVVSGTQRLVPDQLVQAKLTDATDVAMGN